MSTPNTYPLVFNCYKCGKENAYPDQLKQEDSTDAELSVIKRCLNCGLENKVDLPEDWGATNQDSVLRGHTPD
jgi:transcription elongation factor Elf1